MRWHNKSIIDKSKIGEELESGTLSPRSGRQPEAQRAAAPAAERWVIYKKECEPRAEREGGRSRGFSILRRFPVSGKPTPRQVAVAGCRPLTTFGAPTIFILTPGSAADAAPPGATGYHPPKRVQNSAGSACRI